MRDVASLSLDELHALVRAGIRRRLEATSSAERAQAGEELLEALEEVTDRFGGPVWLDGCRDVATAEQ
jgi:hypothetical protein